MPINPIQMPGARPKKDAMDKVLQGLQIANEVFKIPVAYQNYRANQAEADVRGMKARGEVTEADLAQGGYEKVNPASLQPTSQIVPYAPDYHGPRAQLAPEYYGPKPTMVPVAGEGGATLTPVVKTDDRQKFTDQETNLRKEYESLPATKTTQEALAAGKRAMDLLDKPGAKFGPDDLAVISAFTKLNDPGGVVREGDINMATRAQGALSALGAWVEGLTKGVALDDRGRAKMKKTIQTLMDSQAEFQKTVDAKYGQIAEGSGFRPERVVASPLSAVRGYLSEDQEPEPAKASGGKATDKPLFVEQNGHRYMLNKKTGKYE